MASKRRASGVRDDGWVREAKAEDEQRIIDSMVTGQRARTYDPTYHAAKSMCAQNKTFDEIRNELHKPPSFNPSGTAQEIRDYEVEEGLAKLRLKAIQDAVDGKPCVYPMAGSPPMKP